MDRRQHPEGDARPRCRQRAGTRLDDVSAPGQEFGVVGYTHAGGIDRPLVVWKGAGVAPTEAVVPHANWCGVFGKGTTSGGGTSTVPVEWPGFKTTAYHRMGPSQQPATNWMGSLIQPTRNSTPAWIRAAPC
jgi:hypothetical protein